MLVLWPRHVHAWNNSKPPHIVTLFSLTHKDNFSILFIRKSNVLSNQIKFLYSLSEKAMSYQINFIGDEVVIKKILNHLGLWDVNVLKNQCQKQFTEA